MPNRATDGRPSLFINIAAWLLLVMVIASGIAALLSWTGAFPQMQMLRISKFEMRTSSTALLVMVMASIPLWTILHYALRGKVLLFDPGANTRDGWLSAHAQMLEILTAVLGVFGFVALCFKLV